MGNLGDRIFRAPGLFRGDVVDWIGVVPRYYPIFNLADSAIVCGGILTVILAMRGYHLDGTRSVDDRSAGRRRRGRHGDRPAGRRATGENTERRNQRSRRSREAGRSPRAWTGSGSTPPSPGCSASPGPAPPS